MFKKSFFALVAITLMVCTFICQRPVVIAATTDEAAFVTTVEKTNEDGDALVKTCKNDKGETIKAIITRGADVLVAHTNLGQGQATGFITAVPRNNLVDPCALDERQVSETFYIRLYDDNDVIITKYKITIVGMVSRVNSDRYITSVEFKRVSGAVCETDAAIKGYVASATVAYSEDIFFTAYFTLGTGGSFTVY